MAASIQPAPDPSLAMGLLNRHGGRLAEAQSLWPHAPRPWIDLSTGINPFAYPAPRATRVERARLPDPERLSALEAVAGAAFGVADTTGVVAMGGAETGLRLLPALLGASSVAIAEPTYGGHAEAWASAGATLRPWPDGEAEADVVVVTNPNNPDGRTVEPAALIDLADRLARRGGRLVVDESFGEVAPELTLAPAMPPAVIVLRSFGKMYGLAGLRLGFVLADPATAARLRRKLGDWPVAADALAAGLAAYPDAGWLAAMRGRLAAAAARLDRMLTGAGLEVIGGTSLFRLTRSRDARTRFQKLCAMGVLTRPFDDPDRLRFGLPHPSVRARVARALEASR